MSGRRGRGGRGSRKSRGGARPSASRSTQPSPTTVTDKENGPASHAGARTQQLTAEADTISHVQSGMDGSQRSSGSRPLRPTARADLTIMENMRPGRVETMRERDGNSSPAEEENDNIDFFNQQQGLNSDDLEYVEPQRRRQVVQPNIDAQTELLPASGQERQMFSAVTHAVAVPPPASSISGTRLGSLYGPHTHSFPPLSQSSSGADGVRDLLNPLPSSINPLFVQSTCLPARSRHSRPLSITPLQSNTLQCEPTRLPPSASGSRTITGGKRTASDAFSSTEDNDNDDDNNDIEEVRRRKKAASNASRPRYKNYRDDAALLKVLRSTATRLQVHFSTTDPFPSVDAKAVAVEREFTAAREAFEHDATWYALTHDDEKLLGREDSCVRTRVRKEAVTRVAKAYGLVDSPTTAAEVTKNKNQVMFLLADSRFQYESPENKTGRFRHPIISDVVHAAWFNHRNALGCLYQDRFDPIPATCLALVLTAIHHALSMYISGRKQDNEKFKAAAWPRFDEYLLALKQFEYGEMEILWTAYRKHLFQKGLAHGCALKETVVIEQVIPLVPDDEMQREILQLKACLQDGDEVPANNSSAPFAPSA